MADETSDPSLGHDHKRELLAQANRMRGKLIDLELVLSVNGKQDELTRVRQQEVELTSEIRKLRIQIAADWLAKADDLLPQLSDANSQIQRAIREIENKAAVASRIAKVLGLVDQTVDLLGGLLA